MDWFNINIKVEKANVMKQHRIAKRTASLFRFVEICIVLALISRFSIQLPAMVKNYSVCFKDLRVLASPHFVFVIGNVIVITLFMKSGQSSGNNLINDIYEEFLKRSQRSQGVHRYRTKNREAQSSSVHNAVKNVETLSRLAPLGPENIERQNSSVPHVAKNREKQNSFAKQEVKNEETCASLAINIYERSRSEKVEVWSGNRELRRTVTEKCKGSVDYSEGWVKMKYPEDRMSNEEFRSTIECFIERQKRLRRSEENY